MSLSIVVRFAVGHVGVGLRSIVEGTSATRGSPS